MREEGTRAKATSVGSWGVCGGYWCRGAEYGKGYVLGGQVGRDWRLVTTRSDIGRTSF